MMAALLSHLPLLISQERRVSSPDFGASTLITSAPMSAISIVADGPDKGAALGLGFRIWGDVGGVQGGLGGRRELRVGPEGPSMIFCRGHFEKLPERSYSNKVRPAIMALVQWNPSKHGAIRA